MTKKHDAAQPRSFRRWVRRLFSSLTKRPNGNHLEEILRKLQEIEELIEIVAREIARQAKRGK